jgi:hypothetical protein
MTWSFAGIEEVEIKAPWVSEIKDAFDTSCFDDWNHLEDKTSAEYLPFEKIWSSSTFFKGSAYLNVLMISVNT